MKTPITPAEAGREMEYEYWIGNKMPMVHITTTLDITRLVRRCRRDKRLKMNALMCYCISKAAVQQKEFFTLIEGRQMLRSDRLNVQTILKDKNGHLRFCDLPQADTLDEFMENYYRYAKEIYETCEHHLDTDNVFVGTSCASTTLCLDAVVNQCNEAYLNPFLVWSAYKKVFPWRYKLPITLQFHHVQMNGDVACRFMELLQAEFNKL